MRLIIFTTLAVLLQLPSVAQSEFQKGYYITNNDERIECLIQNSDWKKNPSEFKYKISESQAIQKTTLLDVKEFSVPGSFVYVRKIVDIDRSSDNVDEIDFNKNPKWVKDTLFLKVVLSGSATLYSYEQDNFSRYFYATGSSEIKQLVYKRYIVSNNQFSTSRISENATFRQQLWTDVKCGTVNINTISKLRYNSRDLEKYFASHNQCKGDAPESFTIREKKSETRFWVSGGLTYSSASATKSATKFDAQPGVRIGVEIEQVLPGNNNKWSIFIEPSYYSYQSSVFVYPSTFSLNINSIEFPLGVRRYFPLNNEKKLFLNAYYTPTFAINFNSNLTLLELRTPVIPNGKVDIIMGDNLAIGGGMMFKRIKTEIRYCLNRSVIEGVTSYAEYKRLSFTVSYLFANKKTK